MDRDLDGIDLQILEILQANARMSIEEIGKRIGLTKTPTAARIRSMERRGIITGYCARVDAAKVGLPLMAFVAVSLREHSDATRTAFARMVCDLPTVLECYYVSGASDLLLKVRVESIDRYNKEIIDTIANSGHVAKFETNFVMSVSKETAALPLSRLEPRRSRRRGRRSSKSGSPPRGAGPADHDFGYDSRI